MFRHPQLSIVERVISTGGPVAKKAFFRNNFGAVAIKFNTNIQGVNKDCSGIFKERIFGKGRTLYISLIIFKVQKF